MYHLRHRLRIFLFCRKTVSISRYLSFCIFNHTMTALWTHDNIQLCCHWISGWFCWISSTGNKNKSKIYYWKKDAFFLKHSLFTMKKYLVPMTFFSYPKKQKAMKHCCAMKHFYLLMIRQIHLMSQVIFKKINWLFLFITNWHRCKKT